MAEGIDKLRDCAQGLQLENINLGKRADRLKQQGDDLRRNVADLTAKVDRLSDLAFLQAVTPSDSSVKSPSMSDS